MNKIMVVDDDKEFLEEITSVLNAFGYVTIPVSDPSGVVSCASKIKPAAIMLDLKLGTISGFNIARELKRKPETKDIPIIGITGYYTEDDYQELIKVCGIKKRIIKPISPEKIKNVLNEVIKAPVGI